MIFTGPNFCQILHILNSEVKFNFFFRNVAKEKLQQPNAAELLIEHALMKALLHVYVFIHKDLQNINLG